MVNIHTLKTRHLNSTWLGLGAKTTRLSLED